MQLMLHAIIAAACVGAILLLSEFAWRRLGLRGELARKFVHITAGTFIAFLPFWISYGWIAWLGLAFIIGNIINRFTKLFNSVHSVKRVTWGDIFFGLAITLCALIEPSKWIFMAAILQVALADGLAAVMGVAIVKFKGSYQVLGHYKTVAGTAVFFGTSALILIATLVFDPSFASPMSQWPLVLLLALLLTAIENIGLYGFDNLLLPLAVVYILSLL
jgi:phytol kinase